MNQVPTEQTSPEEAYEQRTGRPAPTQDLPPEMKLKIGIEADQLRRAREKVLENQEKEARKEVGEARQSDVNGHILERTRGLSKNPAGQGVAQEPKPAEYFQQLEEQQGFVLENEEEGHILGSDYTEHTENLSRGRVHCFAPIPLPPVNAHNMYPQNQIPVDPTRYVHATHLERQVWQSDITPPNWAPLIQPKNMTPDDQLLMSNVPLLKSRIHPHRDAAQLMAETSELKHLIHPLNRRFMFNEDPYNQKGKEFRQRMGYEQANTQISSAHIGGYENSVESQEAIAQREMLSKRQEELMNEIELEEVGNQKQSELDIFETGYND